MKKILPLSLLLSLVLALSASCGDNLHPAPPDATVAVDAAPDAPDNPRGPSIWWYAYLDWGTAYCQYLDRCDPYAFEFYYDAYLEVCQSDIAQRNCENLDPQHLMYNCQSPYPQDRDTDLAQCQIDMLVLSCTSTTPASCERAFHVDGLQ